MRHLHNVRNRPAQLKTLHLTQDRNISHMIGRAHDLAEGRYSGTWDEQPERIVQTLGVIESERAILHAKDHAKSKR